MKSMTFLYSGEALCEAFGRAVSPLFSRLRLATDERVTLASLRDTLLPKLISGELRLNDPERFIEEVA